MDFRGAVFFFEDIIRGGVRGSLLSMSGCRDNKQNIFKVNEISLSCLRMLSSIPCF